MARIGRGGVCTVTVECRQVSPPPPLHWSWVMGELTGGCTNYGRLPSRSFLSGPLNKTEFAAWTAPNLSNSEF
eukprot:scaffold363207_cov73-Cyclotella_meneghiniana.AAC.1